MTTASDDERIVRRTWQAVADGRAAHVVDGLLARHREGHRRYHGVRHVAAVLRAVDDLLAASAAPVDDPQSVQVAALFHDAVYDPRRSDNEASSAALAASALAEVGWRHDRIVEVERLVLLTAGHELGPDAATTDPAGAVLLDADLGVLGATPSAYQAYVNGVRVEYAHVDDESWRAGRSAVLRNFLARDQIYATLSYRVDREARARANLTAELALLDRDRPNVG